jgi:hypothetical protein
VQTDLLGLLSVDKPARTIVTGTTATKTIVQPKGRIAAQVAHVVSKMRVSNAPLYGIDPYTTIILSVPDSYNLKFRDFLLEENRVVVYRFYDTNEEYGKDSVKTAICTEPIERRKLGYALDYLTLWS